MTGPTCDLEVSWLSSREIIFINIVHHLEHLPGNFLGFLIVLFKLIQCVAIRAVNAKPPRKRHHARRNTPSRLPDDLNILIDLRSRQDLLRWPPTFVGLLFKNDRFFAPLSPYVLAGMLIRVLVRLGVMALENKRLTVFREGPEFMRRRSRPACHRSGVN